MQALWPSWTLERRCSLSQGLQEGPGQGIFIDYEYGINQRWKIIQEQAI